MTRALDLYTRNRWPVFKIENKHKNTANANRKLSTVGIYYMRRAECADEDYGIVCHVVKKKRDASNINLARTNRQSRRTEMRGQRRILRPTSPAR